MSPRRGRARPDLLLGIALVLVVAAIAVSAVVPRARTIDDRARALEATIRCPVCQGLSIADSPAPLAQQMRALVREQLEAGRTDAQILDQFVSRYGRWILLTPASQGPDLILWLLPGALVGGGAVLLVAIGRRRRLAPAPAIASGLAPAPAIEIVPAAAIETVPSAAITPAAATETVPPAATVPPAVTTPAAAIETVPPAATVPAAATTPAAATVPPAAATAPGRTGGSRLVTASLLLVMAAAVAVPLAIAVVPRGPGREITGAPAAGAQAGPSITELEARAAADPRDVTTLDALGDAYLAAERHADAADAYRRALEVDPDDVPALIGLGVITLSAGRPDIAGPLLDRAVRLGPDLPDPYLYRALAIVQSAGGMTEAARRDLLRFIELAPADPRRALADELLAGRATGSPAP